MKKILLVTTGGTIASVQTNDGLAPRLSGRELIGFIPDVMEKFDIEIYQVLNMDSSNIQPEEWRIIAKAIYERYERYDGIIITHGTDTMSYTASMLTFILRDISIPVVITGSQLPISVSVTDAIINLNDSFKVVSSNLKGGIYIVFNRKIILGCRSSKVRTTSFDAFESINYEYVGHVENTHLYILNEYFSTGKPKKIQYDDNFAPDVFLLKLIPGTKPKFFNEFINMGYKGIVIESFGAGGFHYIRRDMPESLSKLVDADIAVVVISQCRYESSDLYKYEVGKKTIESGVIPGYDMTAETAVTKLMWVIAHAKTLKDIRNLMLTNLCDEIRI